MSTLKVNTIQDASGGSSSTASDIASGRAKVWINFQGAGTINIRDSFNFYETIDSMCWEMISFNTRCAK